MKIRTVFLVFLSTFFSLNQIIAGGGEMDLQAWVNQAVSDDPDKAAEAVAALRAQGREGMQAFMEAHATVLKQEDEQGAKYRATLDQIAQQKDSYFSGLFWQTDLAEAQKLSQTQGKPILSLRMLGNLDEDLSCANSRLFRTLLYSDRDFAEYLQEHFVLHWSSERPVPVVTIDYGDGRVMKRTLTGNSIHYVLDAEGRPIEAIPGLNSVDHFRSLLDRALDLHADLQGKAGDAYARTLSKFHEKRYNWLRLKASSYGISLRPLVLTGEPTAVMAERLTVGKSATEMPLLEEMDMEDAAPEKLDPWRDEIKGDADKYRERWQEVGQSLELHPVVGDNSQALILHKNPEKYRETAALAGEVQRIEDILLIETARNELLLHAELHLWFAKGELTQNFKDLNASVYNALFLTPQDDPWLGLKPESVFLALDRDGIVD